MEMTREEVDLSELCRATVQHLAEHEPARTVECVIGDGMTVQGDRTLLAAVVQNLLGNAWKYTAHTEQPRIEFNRDLVDGEEQYFVRDNGAGFDMAHATKLFTPFHRLHNDREFEGTGIGLATVRRIIRRHGGRIWAEAEPGKGATFHFTLPG
jgi:signal transduction histidine kinase